VRQPDFFPNIWAKSPEGPAAAGESLESHTFQVWKNLLRLRARAPVLSGICGMPRLWERSAIAVMAHDLGKCCAGFQNAVRGHAKFPHRHEVLSLAFLPWIFQSDLCGDLPWTAATILTHHKDLDRIQQLYPDEIDFDALDELELEATAAFFDNATEMFRQRFRPLLLESIFPSLDLPAEPWNPGSIRSALRPVMNAAFAVARNIRAQGAISPAALAGRFLRGLLLLSDHAGSAGKKFETLDEIKSESDVLSILKLTRRDLYPHQHQTPAGNATLIAPTGSGKTEASMLWAGRTGAQSNGTPSLFYVLPYQASINAMHARLARVFGESKVAMQHSRAALAVYRELLDREYEPALAAQIARKERSLARLHAKPIRILTPYQLLRGAFQLKGHEALWTDASGSLMILDEIHAYEPVRLGMILATLRHLTRDLGVKALIMSATMPRRLLQFLHELLPDNQHLSATQETFAAFRRHRVNLLEGDLLEAATVDRIKGDAEKGRAVLVVATTVGRAQELYRQLRPSLGNLVSLLHGRFHADDRFRKEKALAHQRGPNGDEPVVLVSTQVVEVSLDVDFDVLYSDPAPLESLVQRFGRINRRRRVPLRDVFVMKSIPEGSPVYKTALLAAALDQLGRIDKQSLDESMIQQMLDSIYEGSLGESWSLELNKHMADFQKNVLDALMPFRSSEDLRDRFDELFDGYQVLPASFEQEYALRLEEDELRAPGLLVPITSGQFFAIKPKPKFNVLIAEREYSEEEGLHIDAAPQIDGI
jgi:CRISPR-associated endonuclease/helicase Cas3